MMHGTFESEFSVQILLSLHLQNILKLACFHNSNSFDSFAIFQNNLLDTPTSQNLSFKLYIYIFSYVGTQHLMYCTLNVRA